MDDQLARRLLRQIKVLNFLIIFFAIIFLVTFAVAGVFAYQAVQEVRDAKQTLNSVQEQTKDTLNVQDELCGSGASSLLKSQTDLCN